ncbi:hypothetical protein [Bradyrhizobium sp. SYSU BS000235]|uniref:hypothetical protein n=1 Tax=Bradyrhizobium sp. SYSU BS000235 TaxID=3411332 RepID=UPI003C78BBF1
MRLLIAAMVVTTLCVGTLVQTEQASADQVSADQATARIERQDAGAATDVSARHRRYHHRRYAYYRATLPYDGYRPYPPPPPCYQYCDRDLNLLPYFGRGW